MKSVLNSQTHFFSCIWILVTAYTIIDSKKKRKKYHMQTLLIRSRSIPRKSKFILHIEFQLQDIIHRHKITLNFCIENQLQSVSPNATEKCEKH